MTQQRAPAQETVFATRGQMWAMVSAEICCRESTVVNINFETMKVWWPWVHAMEPLRPRKCLPHTPPAFASRILPEAGFRNQQKSLR